MRLLLALILSGITSPAFASPEAEVRSTLKAFAAAGDARAIETLEPLLHPQFRVVFAMPGKPGAALMDRASYLGLLKAGKIGGGHREVTIEAIKVSHDLAHAKVSMVRAKDRFTGTATLVRTDGKWQIVQDAVLFAPGG